ncbi:MAG: hypothetical protein HY862_02435 [Chloroflexi bacterium]|nr:hypothetical protein [Chloroflexota bacterium]
MNISRPNFMWPVLIIGIGLFLLLTQIEIVPEAIGDLFIRSWPMLLVIFGLNILLGGRIRYANWVILIAAIALVVVVGNLAYAARRSDYRNDYKESRVEVLPPEVQQLTVNVRVKATRATISASPAVSQIVARFEGSTESDVKIDLAIDGTAATLTITETTSGVLPKLDEVGRGTLNIYLPANVPIANLQYLGEDGSMTVDLRPLTVQVLNIQLKRGNMALYVPTQGQILQDAVRIDNGNLQMFVPQDTALRLSLKDGAEKPTFIPELAGAQYELLGSDLLIPGIANPRILLHVEVDGTFTIDFSPPS